MAQRRMFSKSITNSSNFLMMPQSSQNLYFHLGMNADDDGFCEHFSIMRMTDSKPDDLKVLQAKGYVNVFDDKVLVVIDWKENNYLRNDRYTPSKYLEIYKKELQLLSTSGIPNGDKVATQVRLGKVRVGKGRIGKVITTSEQSSPPIQEMMKIFFEINPMLKFENLGERKAAERIINRLGEEKALNSARAAIAIHGQPFSPTITTPFQLEKKLSELVAFYKKSQSNTIISI